MVKIEDKLDLVRTGVVHAGSTIKSVSVSDRPPRELYDAFIAKRIPLSPWDSEEVLTYRRGEETVSTTIPFLSNFQGDAHPTAYHFRLENGLSIKVSDYEDIRHTRGPDRRGSRVVKKGIVCEFAYEGPSKSMQRTIESAKRIITDFYGDPADRE